MEEKTIHIKRTFDIEITMPKTATKEDAEKEIDLHYVPSLRLNNYDGTYRINHVSLIGEYDQDSFITVSWPESQELCEYEGYMENCTFIMGDSLPCCSYLVNKNWYARLKAGELAKAEEYAECGAI